jgi:hypothetical protein
MNKQKQMQFLSAITLSLLMLGTTTFSKAALAESYSLQGNLKIFKKGGKKTLRHFDNAIVYLEGLSTPAPAEPVGIDQRKNVFIIWTGWNITYSVRMKKILLIWVDIRKRNTVISHTTIWACTRCTVIFTRR